MRLPAKCPGPLAGARARVYGEFLASRVARFGLLRAEVGVYGTEGQRVESSRARKNLLETRVVALPNDGSPMHEAAFRASARRRARSRRRPARAHELASRGPCGGPSRRRSRR